jgi:hypothetical protein
VVRDAQADAGLGAVCIAPATKTVTAGVCEASLRGAATQPLFDIEIFSGNRSSDISWEQIASDTYRVAIQFGTSDSGQMEMSARIPGELEDSFVTTRALEDSTTVSYARSDFSFEEFHLPAATGLVSLGPNRFLILDQAYTRLAPRITRDSGDVLLRDQTQNDEEDVTWVLYIFDGSATDALALAHRVNVEREVSR